MQISIDELRKSMEDYYGTAIFSGMPMAAVDLYRVQNASDEDLIRIARQNGIDLNPFIREEDRRWF